MVNSREEARDLLHDAFIVIYTNIGNLRNEQRLSAWMASIVKNIAKDYLTKSRRDKCIIQEGLDIIEEEDLSVDIPSIEELMALVNALPEMYNKVFRLAVLQNLSHKEIAKLLNIKEHTSASDLARAKELLRKAIRRHWIILPLLILLFFISRTGTQNSTTLRAVIKLSSEESNIEAKGIRHPYPIILNNRERINSSSSGITHSEDELLPNSENQSVQDNSLVSSSDRITIIKDSSTISQSGIYIAWVDEEEKTPKNNKDKISLIASGITLSINDYMNQSGGDGYTLPIEYEYIEQRKYNVPISFGFMVDIPIYDNWSFRTGLEYTSLSSSQNGFVNHLKFTNKQKSHYLGIPASISYDIKLSSGITIQPNLGVSIEIPLASYSRTKYYDSSLLFTTIEDIHASWMFSFGGGVSFNYRFTSHINLFLQPQVRYYYPMGEKSTSNSRTEKPLEAGLSIGIKYDL